MACWMEMCGDEYSTCVREREMVKVFFFLMFCVVGGKGG